MNWNRVTRIPSISGLFHWTFKQEHMRERWIKYSFSEEIGADTEVFSPNIPLSSYAGKILHLDRDIPKFPIPKQISRIAKLPAELLPKALRIEVRRPPNDDRKRFPPFIETIEKCAADLQGLEGIFLHMQEPEFLPRACLDIRPLFKALPALRVFALDLSDDYLQVSHLGSFFGIQHMGLECLLLEPGNHIGALANEFPLANFPSLKTLSLHFGWIHPSRAAMGAFLECTPESLRELRIFDCFQMDEAAIILAKLPLLSQLNVLNLSHGVLTDDGVAALRSSPYIASLGRLVAQPHYASRKEMEKLRKLPIQVDAEPTSENSHKLDFVREARLWRKIRDLLNGEAIICMTCMQTRDEPTFLEIAVRGRVQFTSLLQPFGFEEYAGKIHSDPTWLDIATEAQQAMKRNDFSDRIFISRLIEKPADPVQPSVKQIHLYYEG